LSQPPTCTAVHTFVSDSAVLSNFPGQALDVEFNNVKTTTAQIRAPAATGIIGAPEWRASVTGMSAPPRHRAVRLRYSLA
jgi:hypothetical protein